MSFTYYYHLKMSNERNVTSMTPENRDDDIYEVEGKRLWVIKRETFSLDIRYEAKDYLGAGAYGTVCSAIDKETNCMVAIKKCRKVLQSRTMGKRMLREIRILRLLDHEHVIKIRTILKPSSRESFNNLYIVFEYMESDLAQIIRSSQALNDDHIQVIRLQVKSLYASSRP